MKSIIVSQLANRDERFQLDTATGAISRCAAGGEEKQQLITPSKLPYELSYSSSFYRNPTDKLAIKNERNGIERNISSQDNHLEVDYVYASHGFVSYATMSLTTSGMVAMSSDERWLILLSSSVERWRWLKDWLIERTGWRLSFLPSGLRFKVLIVDLQDDQISTCDLSTHFGPEFVIHPNSTGFAAVDLDRNIFGTPDPASKETVISWYALPLGLAYHTGNQWLVILGTLLTPIILAMLSHLIRRRKPDSYPTDHLIR